MEKVTTEDLFMILDDAQDALSDVKRFGHAPMLSAFVTETEGLIKVVHEELVKRGEL